MPRAKLSEGLASGGVMLLTQEELFARVVGHIGEYLERDVSHLQPDSRLDLAVPGLDSLKRFEMMLYLEDCFGIDIGDEAMVNIKTMQDLLATIEAHLAKVETSSVT
jgi:acyl carrier protein